MQHRLQTGCSWILLCYLITWELLLGCSFLLQKLPHLLGCDRDVEVRDTQVRERIHHRIGDRGRRADGGRLAHAFRAERVVRRRRDRLVGLPLRALERGRHVVVERSEERRVGKGCKSWVSREHDKKE